jgi:hypothetical protein
MRTRIFAAVFGLLLAAVLTSGSALAGPFSGSRGGKSVGSGGGSGSAFSRSHSGHPHHHRHTSIGVGFAFGYPFWGPWYYPPPYYYPVALPVQPVTYIERVAEQQRPSPTPEPGAWWYYCGSSKGYYPHVKACPTGWQRVPPTPPN